MPKALVTGGAGFLGSHLVDRLLAEGWSVVSYDSYLTGSETNLAGAREHPEFRAEERDVTEPFETEERFDWILHLASPASPVDYLAHPIHTLKLGAVGTLNCLELARMQGAGLFLASTSEVYGDPQVHPQPESYWGHVNPIGPRSVYDEAKRFAEAAVMAYQRTHGLKIRIARFFNTYGPRMRRKDGRAVPNFVIQSLAGEALTVHGDGSQTRSLCYVDDSIEAVWRFLAAGVTGPMNIGNPHEVTVLELAETIRSLAGSGSEIRYVERPVDDPERRRPDIALARAELDWEPRTPLKQGLEQTIAWARGAWV